MPETAGLGSVPYIVLGLYLCVLLIFGIWLIGKVTLLSLEALRKSRERKKLTDSSL